MDAQHIEQLADKQLSLLYKRKDAGGDDDMTTQAFKRLAQAMTRISLALKLSSSIYSKVLSALEAGIGAKAPAVAPKEGEVQRAAEAEGGSLATGACQLLWLLIQGSRTRQQQAADCPGLIEGLVRDMDAFGSREESALVLAYICYWSAASSEVAYAAGAIPAILKHLPLDQPARDLRNLMLCLGNISAHIPRCKPETVRSPGLMEIIMRSVRRGQPTQARNGASILILRLLAPTCDRDGEIAADMPDGPEADPDPILKVVRDAFAAQRGIAKAAARLVIDARKFEIGGAGDAYAAALAVACLNRSVAEGMLQEPGFFEALLRQIRTPLAPSNLHSWGAIANAPQVLRQIVRLVGGLAEGPRKAALEALNAASMGAMRAFHGGGSQEYLAKLYKLGLFVSATAATLMEFTESAQDGSAAGSARSAAGRARGPESGSSGGGVCSSGGGGNGGSGGSSGGIGPGGASDGENEGSSRSNRGGNSGGGRASYSSRPGGSSGSSSNTRGSSNGGGGASSNTSAGGSEGDRRSSSLAGKRCVRGSSNGVEVSTAGAQEVSTGEDVNVEGGNSAARPSACPNQACGKQCAECGSVGKLRVCTGCNQAWFCSVDCQKANWPKHKPKCKALQQGSKEDRSCGSPGSTSGGSSKLLGGR